MTGKEALEIIRDYKIDTTDDCYFAEEEVPLLCIFPREIITIENELKELNKYKRAFEILKSKEIFEFKDDNCLYLNAEDHNWWGDIIESSFVRLSDEEYELLEELMKSEI